MKSIYIRYTLGIALMAIITSCNSNNKGNKEYDSVTDQVGHPLENRDTVVEYKENDSIQGDTSLPADKH